MSEPLPILSNAPPCPICPPQVRLAEPLLAAAPRSGAAAGEFPSQYVGGDWRQFAASPLTHAILAFEYQVICGWVEWVGRGAMDGELGIIGAPRPHIVGGLVHLGHTSFGTAALSVELLILVASLHVLMHRLRPTPRPTAGWLARRQGLCGHDGAAVPAGRRRLLLRG